MMLVVLILMVAASCGREKYPKDYQVVWETYYSAWADDQVRSRV